VGERFDAQLHAEVERARRSRRAVSLLLIRRNRLDKKLSARVAAALVAQKRAVDVAGLIGEGRFTVILPETDEAGALQAARRIRSEITRSLGDEAGTEGVRLGVATFPRHADSDAALLRAAAAALSIAEDLVEAAPLLTDDELPVTVAPVVVNDKTPERHLGALLSLAETADMRARGRSGHSQHVARYAELIARELGLRGEVVQSVRIAAVLHDVGNVGVPERVLRHAGPLSEDDWELVKSHPYVGARLLDSAGLAEVREWVLRHHECMDGSGYPGGLRASEIPLGARIIAVADAFEAMTQGRPHRGAMPKAAAEQELMECSGVQFDRRVVQAFTRALARRAHTLSLGIPA
jgi:HD-GYP domain-containing protein (c-di-GMP phosphodiesterase class II)